MISSDLLNEQLEWPRDQWRRGGVWRLGQGLTAVGPGWHPLVTAAFAAVAEVAGAEVRDVRQRNGILEICIYHPDETPREALRCVAAACTEASRSRREGCGATVPAVPPAGAVWRNHCAECEAIIGQGGPKSERRLWEQRAGRQWPRMAGW